MYKSLIDSFLFSWWRRFFSFPVYLTPCTIMLMAKLQNNVHICCLFVVQLFWRVVTIDTIYFFCSNLYATSCTSSCIQTHTKCCYQLVWRQQGVVVPLTEQLVDISVSLVMVMLRCRDGDEVWLLSFEKMKLWMEERKNYFVFRFFLIFEELDAPSCTKHVWNPLKILHQA